MKVIFYPPNSNSNDYVNLMIKNLKAEGAEILNEEWNSDLKFILYSLVSALKYKDVILHFNWLEDNASRSGIKAKIKCNAILLFLKFFSFFGGKIVWTMHNLSSHNQNSNYEKKFIKKMLRNVSAVVVHCTYSIDYLITNYQYKKEKVFYIPHGNYCDLIKDNINSNKRRENQLHFLYFGSISKYKGVVDLMKAFSNSSILKDFSSLFICGRPNSEDLKQEILARKKEVDAISLDLSFVDNEKLIEYIATSDFVILPYDKDSMLNSGSLILALSVGKPIIVPYFGYIYDIKDYPFIYAFNYDSKEEKINKIQMFMEKIVIDYKDKNLNLLQLDNEAKEFALNKLNWKKISQDLINLYSSIR